MRQQAEEALTTQWLDGTSAVPIAKLDSLARSVLDLCDETERLREALAEYEKAVQRVLKVAPNHWHHYRDPLEHIYAARKLGQESLAGGGR